MNKILSRRQLRAWCDEQRAHGKTIVSTNGCFDILHVGHVQLLQQARALGDTLIVLLNADTSVKKLKGASRPINDENARAQVLSALESVTAVCVFKEETPIRVLEDVSSNIHVKGGDYKTEDLPESKIVRDNGGEIVIVPLVKGFSTTKTLEKSHAENEQFQKSSAVAHCWVVIPARYGSTRFPGKPLANLGNRPVIAHVVERALQTKADRPVFVATDDERIARAVEERFATQDARVVLTSVDCATGTDRIAEVVTRLLNENTNNEYSMSNRRAIVVNIQGDEPFVNPTHIDQLFDALKDDTNLQMATLATPIIDSSQIDDTAVVKVVCARNGDALYFSRCSIPFERDVEFSSTASSRYRKLRHIGVYAYEAKWLLQMAQLPPTPLEELEKLEQLRALEHGVAIRVLEVRDVISIAIDTPADLIAAQKHWKENNHQDTKNTKI